MWPGGVDRPDAISPSRLVASQIYCFGDLNYDIATLFTFATGRNRKVWDVRGVVVPRGVGDERGKSGDKVDSWRAMPRRSSEETRDIGGYGTLSTRAFMLIHCFIWWARLRIA